MIILHHVIPPRCDAACIAELLSRSPPLPSTGVTGASLAASIHRGKCGGHLRAIVPPFHIDVYLSPHSGPSGPSAGHRSLALDHALTGALPHRQAFNKFVKFERIIYENDLKGSNDD